MAWYRTGTIAVTNGSQIVTGTGTAFVANTQIGHAINLPDGRAYEVAAINSDTQITIGNPTGYLGATASGQAYSIQPNQGFAQQAATALATFLSQVNAWIAGALAGRFGDGTAAAPGITFASDQDTGLRRAAENVMAIVTGGSDRVTVDASGNVGIGTASPASTLHAVGTGRIVSTTNNAGLFFDSAAGEGWLTAANAAGSLLLPLNLRATVIRLSPGGTEAARVDASGNVGIGTSAPANKLHIVGVDANTSLLRLQNTNGRAYALGSGIYSVNNVGFSITDLTSGTSPLAIDGNGNLLLGLTSTPYACHTVRKSTSTENVNALVADNGGNAFFVIANGNASGWSATASVAYVGKNSGTGRSLTAGGTLNASGADYAEYMTKAQGCGTILKGDVCGVGADGKLVTTWAAALSFVVKSTNPNLVGGDTWAAHLGDRPNEPVLTLPLYEGPAKPIAPIAPIAPAPIGAVPTEPVRDEVEDDDAFALRKATYLLDSAAWIKLASDHYVAVVAYTAEKATYDAAIDEYRIDLTAYDAAIAAHEAAITQAEADQSAAHIHYLAELETFEEALETARGTVDRVAFCGQVPVNVSGPFAVGDYIVAAQDGDAIRAVAIGAEAITFDQYRGRIGKVWAVRDGRAWIDVQHG